MRLEWGGGLWIGSGWGRVCGSEWWGKKVWFSLDGGKAWWEEAWVGQGMMGRHLEGRVVLGRVLHPGVMAQFGTEGWEDETVGW